MYIPILTLLPLLAAANPMLIVAISEVPSNAAPGVTADPSSFCPTGTWYQAKEDKCPSGFIGCVNFARYSSVCAGSKRFYNDCSGEQGLGNFYNCANGFIGCTTRTNVCDLKGLGGAEALPVQIPIVAEGVGENAGWKCPPDTTYFGAGVCATGYLGCLGNKNDVRCSGKVEPGVCPIGTGIYNVCGNGFKGCSTNVNMC
ncbi:hypothetical protein EJ06DRAFT_524447 [Trichodelitschia bisporula]|uniref:Uncharacterized protein n=1 Tax=Trichodelitschia bisporula TaxID=703511 RepID=A0A6G1HM63_9PEZI|nr:hypothetical protein EJ06DRAFT_524447 [Trichodelitschia bisporula]